MKRTRGMNETRGKMEKRRGEERVGEESGEESTVVRCCTRATRITRIFFLTFILGFMRRLQLSAVFRLFSSF